MLTEFAIDRPSEGDLVPMSWPARAVSSTIMPDGFLAIAAICRPRGATCWVVGAVSWPVVQADKASPTISGNRLGSFDPRTWDL